MRSEPVRERDGVQHQQYNGPHDICLHGPVDLGARSS